jgi:hypothetical protein
MCMDFVQTIGIPIICDTTFPDWSDSDGGYAIRWKRSDHLEQSAPTSRRCEEASNGTCVSDCRFEKQDLHTISTDAGSSIVSKPVLTNADSSIRCNSEFDSSATDGSAMQRGPVASTSGLFSNEPWEF